MPKSEALAFLHLKILLHPPQIKTDGTEPGAGTTSLER